MEEISAPRPNDLFFTCWYSNICTFFLSTFKNVDRWNTQLSPFSYSLCYTSSARFYNVYFCLPMLLFWPLHLFPLIFWELKLIAATPHQPIVSNRVYLFLPANILSFTDIPRLSFFPRWGLVTVWCRHMLIQSAKKLYHSFTFLTMRSHTQNKRKNEEKRGKKSYTHFSILSFSLIFSYHG